MRVAALLVCALLAGCASLASPRAGERAALAPPSGKQLLVAGQYGAAAWMEQLWLGPPGGFMHYVRLGPSGAGDAGPAGVDVALPALRKRAASLPGTALQLGVEALGNLEAIASGALDAEIDRLLEALTQLDRPVYLRLAYEAEGFWNRYEPDAFRPAWRHFRQRLASSGARNVAMVWHVAADCSGTYGKRPLLDWYPGDDAVDWIAISWFTPADCDYRPPRALTKLARERGKPLMIAEATPKGYDLSALTYSRNGRDFEPRTPDQIWNDWFAPMLAFVAANADVVGAVSYISDQWDAVPRWGPPYTHGYWGDSRLQANPEILARWRDAMRSKRWLRGGAETLKRLAPAGP